MIFKTAAIKPGPGKPEVVAERKECRRRDTVAKFRAKEKGLGQRKEELHL